ncbi:alpha/beta-hydrolase [Hortaea werneckii]|nr:alpha/beta-hydrolase [Hortaea werneckii]KAI7097139.1 alpha/beta-hydrolase [Hortaea werneckii]KAI7224558.1 alpha/beta-hydrolase [Hortaea werneckii]KAI7320151.1 alpha/beta-hydrolase [Hortaea werneckii]KAI7389452.1 alpha/beta-hydrolase [Hortaea werneckii]
MEETKETRPTVTIRQGTLKGKVLSSTSHPVPIEAWLGVRYAKPPVGELRFARPVALPPSDEVFDALEWGYRCPGKQLITSFWTPKESEDCLTLNVFRQKGMTGVHQGNRLPVMLYLHGGAFNRGTACMHDDASMLSWSEKPYIAISCNYRIGALGFLNCSLTAKEGVLNLGLHDQRLVLEWVQENVGAFGGDPANVTLVGLSAGAHSIGHHITNVNEKRELFQRAVIQSGGPTSRVVHPFDSALHEKQFQEFLEAVECPKDLPECDIMSFLRKLTEPTICNAQTRVFDTYNPSVRWAWQPVIDYEIISRRPLDAWKSGDWHKVPIITGFNHNEGSMYVPKAMTTSEEFRTFFATLLPQLEPKDLDRLEELYPDPAKDPGSPYTEHRKDKLGPQYKRVEAAYGQYAYVAPVRQTAELAGSDKQQPPIYLYHWASQSSVVNGANHGDQLWYETMDEKVRDVSPSHDALARVFHDYICNFITSGNPNRLGDGAGKGLPVWKAFNGKDEAGRTMVFGDGNNERAGGKDAGIVAQLIKDPWAVQETDFWWQMGERFED